MTEGSSSNAWIVTGDDKVVTHPVDNGILRGITRTVLIESLQAQGSQFEERAFSVEEAYAAREVFLTSASQIVMPVVRIDGRLIGNGRPGPVAATLRRDFHSPRRSRLIVCLQQEVIISWPVRKETPIEPVQGSLPPTCACTAA